MPPLPDFVICADLALDRRRRSYCAEFPDSVLSDVSAWLLAALDRQEAVELPVQREVLAHARRASGGVLVTILDRQAIPLVTIGVARRARNAKKLWSELVSVVGETGATMPGAPWCGIAAHAEGLRRGDSPLPWLPAFAAALAWAWIMSGAGPEA